MSLKLLMLLAIFAVSQTAFALTKVTASVDANPVISNESIVLTVVADDSVERDSLDTTPLLKDFILARTEVSSQTSMVNFKTSRTTRWQIVLIPRQTGNLIIPALTIDDHHSKAINVQVIEQDSANSTQQQDIFITTELSANDVYVQQLLALTIKLHIGVQLQRGSLTEPNLTNATIEQIGKDIESEGIVNGKRYRIIERTYAITPEQSGKFTLDTPMFSGDVMVQSKRRSGFLSFGETKPVNISGDKLTLNVRPIPDSYPIDATSSWLPSELLTLHQEWQPVSSQGKNEFKVGEPITRTITLTAAGLGKAQLPKITMNAPNGLKIYPDQAELHSNLTKERLISQKRQNFAIVASRAGEYILPKITIAWWNTVTNKYQQAVLPAQTITVRANADLPQPPITNNPATTNTLSNSVSNNPLINNTADPLLTQPIVIEKTSYLQWLFLALWVLTAFAWATHVFYLKRNNSLNTDNVKHQKINNHYLALMAACKQNNAEQALSLILPWLNNLSSHHDNIEISTLAAALTHINNEAFTCAINDVQQHLYGKKSVESSWVGEDLLKAIQQVNAAGFEENTTSKFTLNPN
ncbi:BatD family protein [Candidatus Colwellia aromaticivorans]|uniref:BatD family protein n=1 Tax=Candidatus Colwellia aromaticivorans TaxID=2267621 RepID=UPI000DF3D8BD|nr:BatD family protein [Candidatus Colwellia aromaticivorans]